MILPDGLRTVLLSLFAATGLIAVPCFCDALEIEPGQWESSETSDVDGKAEQPEVSIDCVTAEDARDPVKALAGMQVKQAANAGCLMSGRPATLYLSS